VYLPIYSTLAVLYGHCVTGYDDVYVAGGTFTSTIVSATNSVAKAPVSGLMVARRCTTTHGFVDGSVDHFAWPLRAVWLHPRSAADAHSCMQRIQRCF
jgi:hypothetical protein